MKQSIFCHKIDRLKAKIYEKKAKIFSIVLNYICGADKERNYLDNLHSFPRYQFCLSYLDISGGGKMGIDCAKAENSSNGFAYV